MALDQLNAVPAPDAFAGAGTPNAALEVTYDWNLATDAVTWGSNLDEVISFGTEHAFATGLGYAEHLAPESTSSRYEAIVAAGGCDTGGGVAFKVIYGLSPYARSGSAPVWVEDVGRWFADFKGRPSKVKGVIRVVTERHEAERALAVRAQRDLATGAFNRDYFIDHIERYLALSTRKHTTFAVLLAHLVVIVDGEVVEDAAKVAETMIAATVRMRQEMRGAEVLARFDATSFGMLLENCNGEQMAAAAARLAAASRAAPIQTSFGVVRIDFRVGGVIAPLHGRTASVLLDCAREALGGALQPGGPGFVRYEPDMARTAEKRKLLQATDAIIAALNEGRVVLALQPVVDAKTREIIFCEALVRIRNLDDTLIMPDVLVPAAEQGGLVALLDRRVVDLAFAQLVADSRLSLSVNASVMSLHDQQWQDHFRAACALRPEAASRLIVEITETCAIADLEATRAVLLALKALDVKIAIDDFGSGHSSFRSLRDLPIDYLKIDGAFARNLARSPDDRFFIKTLIDLAKNLRIPTIAEWVEDEATARALTEWGVDLLQGHLFGKAEVGGMDFEPVSAHG